MATLKTVMKTGMKSVLKTALAGLVLLALGGEETIVHASDMGVCKARLTDARTYAAQMKARFIDLTPDQRQVLTDAINTQPPTTSFVFSHIFMVEFPDDKLNVVLVFTQGDDDCVVSMVTEPKSSVLALLASHST